MSLVQCLSRFQLVCADIERTAGFYETAFGFTRTGGHVVDAATFGPLIGLPNASARIVSLRLGQQSLDLLEIEPLGARYPDDVSGQSPLFQHLAIVVDDMTAACARLSRQRGWRAISLEGPQTLPASSGGVTAFKFRDPEGHPLELLHFPAQSTPAAWRSGSPGGFRGIDHSAISVAETARSIAFYRGLGLRPDGGSLNSGPQQSWLDGIDQAVVTVSALAPAREGTPHLELLCYGSLRRERARTNDVAATRLVFQVEEAETIERLCAQNAAFLVGGPLRLDCTGRCALLRDPDGHLLVLEAPL